MSSTIPLQRSLFDPPELIRKYDGATYSAPRDEARMNRQLQAVFDLMKDGKWRTLDEICGSTGYASQAAISARLRDLRKDKFGRHEVERQNVSGGLWQYRVIGK